MLQCLLNTPQHLLKCPDFAVLSTAQKPNSSWACVACTAVLAHWIDAHATRKRHAELRPVWKGAGSQPLVPETPSDQEQPGSDAASASGSGVTVSWGTGPSTEWPSRPRFDRNRCAFRETCPSEWKGMRQVLPIGHVHCCCHDCVF